MALKSILGPLGELLELSWQPGVLLEASWNAVGALLEASGAEKKILGAALGRSKRNPKTGFSYLRGQKAPKTEPGRVQNGVPNRVLVEKGETTTCLSKGPESAFMQDLCARMSYCFFALRVSCDRVKALVALTGV